MTNEKCTVKSFDGIVRNIEDSQLIKSIEVIIAQVRHIRVHHVKDFEVLKERSNVGRQMRTVLVLSENFFNVIIRLSFEMSSNDGGDSSIIMGRRQVVHHASIFFAPIRVVIFEGTVES